MINVRVWVVLLNFGTGALYFLLFIPAIFREYHHHTWKFLLGILACIVPGIFYAIQAYLFVKLCLTDPGYQKISRGLKFPGQRRCIDCKGFQQRGASHCRQCSRCVAWRDWHCSLLGVCISVRNFQVFLIWLLAATVCAAMFSFCGMLTLLGREGHIGNLEISSLVAWLLCYACSAVVIFYIPLDSASPIWPGIFFLGTAAAYWVHLTWKFLLATVLIVHVCSFALIPMTAAIFRQFHRGFRNRRIYLSEIFSEISPDPESWYFWEYDDSRL